VLFRSPADGVLLLTSLIKDLALTTSFVFTFRAGSQAE